LMAHTFVGENEDEIATIAKPAMTEYIKVNLNMQKDHATATKDEEGSLRKTTWVNPEVSRLNEQQAQDVIEYQVRNNLKSPMSFIGTLDQCAQQAARLSENEVDEIACLIDFGVGFNDVMASLQRLSKLLS
jgi:alkanesulfonate monooxygenase SsuD/methylene tetrahydromethanopterin reductase-like flavin-dependent oxidoreductase (luciferase family)